MKKLFTITAFFAFIASTAVAAPSWKCTQTEGWGVDQSGVKAPISYRLDLLENVELAGEYFEPKKDCNFKEWASESFGVFHGDALWNIKIRFAKEVAKRAEKVQFHPSQKISHGRNGSLVMELRCRGHRELIWELMHPDWLGFVQIESPDRLKEEYAEQLERAKKAVFAE